MTEPTRDDLRVAVFKKPGWGHRSIDDAEFAAIARKDGWVKPDERWRFCPMCGRADPTRATDADEGPSCLPTNCDAWVMRVKGDEE
jgi:NADH pyrophosphatase NudC (nudix superfamily)